MVTTSNMGLILPDPLVTVGPTWATNLNTAITSVDEHDHTAGKGVQVPTAGINVNGDLTFSNYNLTSVNSTRHRNQDAVLSAAADINATYFVNGNFYVNNADGTAVQITDGTGINIASTGTIGGDYGQPGVTAAATYSDSTKAFSWVQSAGVTAKMAFGDILLYENIVSANPVTIKSPTSLGSAITITTPSTTTTLSGTTIAETISGLKTFTAANTHSGDEVFTGVTSGTGIMPLGSIVAVASGLSGAFTIPATGVVSEGWQYCDGAAVAGGQSVSGTTPDLTDSRFLMGSTSSGTTGGATSSAHTHTHAHTHGMDSQLGTITLAHSHTVTSHTHANGHIHQWIYNNTSGNTFSHQGSTESTGEWTTGITQPTSGRSFQAYSSGAINYSLSTSTTGKYFTSGALASVGGAVKTVTGGAAPGMDSQLGNYAAAHSHTTNTQSSSTTSAASATENRPLFYSAQYLIRVS